MQRQLKSFISLTPVTDLSTDITIKNMSLRLYMRMVEVGILRINMLQMDDFKTNYSLIILTQLEKTRER